MPVPTLALMSKTTSLAAAFSDRVRKALSPAELATVNERNLAHGLTKSDICATHDFTDANELMAAAWADAFGPIDESYDADDNPVWPSEADMRIWNAAWQMAKESRFTL